MDFSTLAASEELRQAHYVDDREWQESWANSWVVYADLLAFAARCTRSDGSAVNTIVRFHRALAAATQGLVGHRSFQFTDAGYFITPSPRTALAFASNLQNECLAHNALQLERPTAVSQQLLYPRITIARGRVLTVSSKQKKVPPLDGIDAEHMLAGAGVVAAYQLEKRTTGLLTSFGEANEAALRRVGCAVVRGRASALYRAWSRDDAMWRFRHDGVLDHPWVLLEPRQTSAGEFTPESDDALEQKLQSLMEVQRIWFSSFVVTRDPGEVAKHYGGLLRFLADLLQGLEQLGRRRWDLRDMAESLERLFGDH